MFVKQIISMDDAKKMIENGEVIFLEDGDRRLFKTSSMVAYAYWSGKPLGVSTQAIKRLIQSDYPFGKHIDIHAVNLFGKYSKSHGIDSTLLVDDISYDEYKRLKALGYKVAGFVRK